MHYGKIIVSALLLCIGTHCNSSKSSTAKIETEYQGDPFEIVWRSKSDNHMKMIVVRTIAISKNKTISEVGGELVGKLLFKHSVDWVVPESEPHHEVYVISHQQGVVAYEFSIKGSEEDFSKIINDKEIANDDYLLQEYKGFKLMVVKGNRCHLLFGSSLNR